MKKAYLEDTYSTLRGDHASFPFPFSLFWPTPRCMKGFILLQSNMMSYFNSHKHLSTTYFLWGDCRLSERYKTFYLSSLEREVIAGFLGELSYPCRELNLSVSVSLCLCLFLTLWYTHTHTHPIPTTNSDMKEIVFVFLTLWKRRLDYPKVRGTGLQH